MTSRFTLRRVLLLGAAIAVLNSAVGPSAQATTSSPLDPPLIGAALGPAAGTSGPDSSGPGSGTDNSGPDSSGAPDTVHFTFDGASLLADITGHGHDLSPVSRHGGAFAMVAHDSGRALAFPPPCHDEPCPRIALRAATAADLDPGTRPIRWGASVRLGADQTTKGENVLQKGYSASGSQYKLQIDGLPGHPSCVMVDDKRPQIHVAKSRVSVADGRWHTLECRRSGARLMVLVDGVKTGATRVPADLSVRNTIPLSVGGKGSFTDNDQFQGDLDDVWVSIG